MARKKRFCWILKLGLCWKVNQESRWDNFLDPSSSGVRDLRLRPIEVLLNGGQVGVGLASKVDLNLD